MRKFVSVGEDRYHILAEVPITSNIDLEALKKMGAKIKIKDEETAIANNKASGKAKLKAGEALNDAELSALFGD